MASWPSPSNGTFIVAQLNGGAKTFKDVAATYYTLTSEGRAQYDNHPVEWYLYSNSSTSTPDNAVAAAIEALMNKTDSSLSNYLATQTGKRLDSENPSTKAAIKDLMSSGGIDLSSITTSWSLSSDGNSYSLLVSDHKLTYNGDHGKKNLSVLIYRGTANADGSITWGSSTSSTASVTMVPGSKYYPILYENK